MHSSQDVSKDPKTEAGEFGDPQSPALWFITLHIQSHTNQCRLRHLSLFGKRLHPRTPAKIAHLFAAYLSGTAVSNAHNPSHVVPTSDLEDNHA